MNRQTRRQQDKNLKKNTQAINSLTPAQARIADLVADERANIYINNFNKTVDRNMTAALINYGVNYEDIEGIQNDMSILFEEDTIKSKKLNLEEGLNLTKIELEVREAVREVLKNFTVKKLAIEELAFKFPKLSKSMLINAYGSVELELKKEVYKDIEKVLKDLNADETIKLIVNKYKLIKDIASKYYYAWKKDYMLRGPVSLEKATPQEIEKNAEKIIKKAKERQCIESVAQKTIIEKEEEVIVKGLKIVESNVVVRKTIKVEGENGAYAADTINGVILSKNNMVISFNNIEELETWVSEFKEVFTLVS